MTVVSKLREFRIDPTEKIGLICEVKQREKWLIMNAFFGQIAVTERQPVAYDELEFDPEHDLLVQLPIKNSADFITLTLLGDALHLFRFKTNLVATDVMRVRIWQGEVFFEHVSRILK